MSILSGEKTAARYRQMNAAAALIAVNQAAGFNEGVVSPGAAIDSGKALQKMEELIAFSQNSV